MLLRGATHLSVPHLGARLSETEDHRECSFCSRPKLAYQLFTTSLDEVAQNKRDDECVVELSRHGDEVGYEIERQAR